MRGLDRMLVWLLQKRGINVASDVPPAVQAIFETQLAERDRHARRMEELDRMAVELGITPLVRQVARHRKENP